MDVAQIKAKLATVSEQVSALGVTSLCLFGSVVRGENRADSDLDFLVDFDGPATFDRYMSLRELLERELGAQIDLVTRRALKPRLQDAIQSEAVRVA